MEYEQEQIKNKVFMENESRKVLNEILPLYSQILNKYKNQQILKVDKSFLKKVDDEIRTIKPSIKINPLNSGDSVNISYCYLKVDLYTISLKLNLCFNGGSYEDKTYYCNYYESYKYICDIENLKIKSFYPYEELKQIDFKKEIEVYNKAKELKKLLDDTLSKFSIYEFRELIR
jgi:hypothetical protein